jgi:site-specific recombinase XerD
MMQMNQEQVRTFEPRSTIFQLKERLAEMNYSKSTIDRLDSVWRNFVQYWDDHPQLEFCIQAMQEFISFRYGCQLGDKDKAHNVRRAMNMLWDFAQYHQVFKQSSLTAHKFRVEYRDAFERFLSYLVQSGYSRGSIRTFRSRLFQFESYLLNNKISSLDALTSERLKEYTKTLGSFAPKTAVRKLRLLQQFLKFAYENGLIMERLSLTIPKPRIPRNLQLPTVFTKEEVNALLAAVDRSNPLGKRDYAILILAAGLGLRVSDIIGLTFDEIDWSKKLLSIVQQKTGKLVELPLTDEIGWAIIDYLQNGRPQSECDHVFIKHCAPYDALTPSMYRTVQKYLQKAGIKRPVGKSAGMHSFRHSLASAMLEQEIPLPVISGTLGHSDMHSTETYLSIDLHQLRSCALEVDE